MDKRTQKMMFSSEDLNAITPQDFYEQLNEEFGFQTDLAADKKNTKCQYYYDEDANALEQDWAGICWCNPPYGRNLLRWVAKAAVEAEETGGLVVMLLPARTDTRWFRVVADTADEIRFIQGRLKFEGNDTSAPFPSMLAIWYGKYHKVGKYVEGPYNYNLIWRR